ncbi:MAG: glycosyltransferase [Anaerolineales bacterium]|nr:glycosyltransferase [Anaerolineales bacterium]
MTRPLRILTWHVHGNYLYYLAQVPHEFYLPIKPGRPEGYGGRLPGFNWPSNVHDIPAEAVRETTFDCILYQSHKNYLEDQHEILSPAQRCLPRIFLEHNPPRQHPTHTHHPVDDPNVLLVHVTHFNELMWDNGRTPTRVIEHGVIVPEHVRYSGELERGIVVVNSMKRRGRLTGADVFQQVCAEVPVDLVGMDSEALGGLGEIDHDHLHALAARYRFFFNPIRYTSLGLAVCEAMMVGLPIIGLATTEMVTAVQNGVTGYVSTSVPWLIERMHDLLTFPGQAQLLGEAARQQALDRFHIDRFSRDWEAALNLVTGKGTAVFPAIPLPASPPHL